MIRVGEQQGGAIGAFVQFALAESQQPRIGGDVVLRRLSELMFVDVVRRYLETLPADRTGWLAGLRDQFVGRALTALHRSPAHDWTLESAQASRASDSAARRGSVITAFRVTVWYAANGAAGAPCR